MTMPISLIMAAALLVLPGEDTQARIAQADAADARCAQAFANLMMTDKTYSKAQMDQGFRFFIGKLAGRDSGYRIGQALEDASIELDESKADVPALVEKCADEMYQLGFPI